MNIDNSRTEDDRQTTGSNKLDRRRFLLRLSLGLGSIGAAIVSIPVIGFLLSPLIQKRPQIWRSVGTVNNFEIGKTVEVSFQDASPLPWAGVTAKTAAWLRRETETFFVAFSINCTHLGCPVRWLADADLFMCPCHGGVYYRDGAVASGPPPKALSRYPVRVHGGRVEVLTSPVPLV
jgi:menaquinol-cytochrome c reductase iron-sulfur subunit